MTDHPAVLDLSIIDCEIFFQIHPPSPPAPVSPSIMS